MKISSFKNKILIFSDVHQDISKVEKIIESEAADINLCLGDWFDSFQYDSEGHLQKTTKYLKDTFCKKSNNITLFGNHDLHYFFDNKFTFCSGYGNAKNLLINNILGNQKKSIIENFKWFVFVDEFLCTHAGLHSIFIPPSISDNEGVYDYLTIQSNDADIKIRTNQSHWFYNAGYARGGSQQKGGIVWLDFDQEFAPIKGLSQIVGHTYRRKNKIQSYAKSNNYCIDTNLIEYITIMNGVLNIKNYNDL